MNYDAIASYNWPHKIGYYNGQPAWTREQIADAAARGELLALVDVQGTAPYAASILDWERGEQNPDLLREWVQARNLFRGDAAVYCSPDSLTTVINALQGEPCRIWLAEPTGNHEPPRQPPPLGLPPNLILLGIQYATSPHSGGDYDISVLYDDTWHNTEVHHEDLLEVAAGEIEPRTGAGPLAMAAAAAAPTAGEQNLANLEAYWTRQEAAATAGKAPAASPDTAPAAAPAAPAAPASSPILETGQNMMNPEASPPSPPAPGSPPAAGSPESSGPSALPPRPVPAAALSRQPAAAPAPSSSSPARPSTQPSGFQIPPGLLQPPGPTAGLSAPAPPAPATSPSAGTGASDAPATASTVHDPIGTTTASATPPILQLLGAGPPSTTPAAPAPAAGPPASPLPHDWIKAVLADMRQAATLFRSAGVHHPARLLEEAAATAAEAGSLLMRAGL